MTVIFKLVETSEEIEQVAELAHKIWREHYNPLIGNAQVEFMLEKFQSAGPIAKQIQEDNYLYYLLQDGDRYVGYCAFQERGKSLFLSKIYVDSSERGRGFGRAIMEFAKESAINLGLKTLSLTVNKDNADSIAVYKKIGFKVVEEICPDIGGGYVMDDYVMELDLIRN